MENHWQITYPEGMIKYVDFFRNELFQYHIYDAVVQQYINKYANITVKNMCALGCGTGRHESELKRMGYEITGIERNSESFPVVQAVFQQNGVEPITMVEADFFNFELLKVFSSSITF